MQEKICEKGQCEDEFADSCPIDLHVFMLRCQENVYNRVNDVEKEMKEIHGRMDNMEANQSSMKSTLDRHEQQRKEFNSHIVEQIKIVNDKVDGEIVSTLSRMYQAIMKIDEKVDLVTAETEKNSTFIGKVKKYWFGLSVAGTVTVTLVVSIWQILSWAHEHGMFILLPQVSTGQ